MHLAVAAGLPRLCLALHQMMLWALPRSCPGVLLTHGRRMRLHQGWRMRLSQHLHGALMQPKDPRIDPRLFNRT